MMKGKRFSLLLAVSLALLAVLVVALSRFPVNEGVTDAEWTAEWEKALYEAERKAYAAAEPDKVLRPAMILATADSGDTIAVPGFVRLFADEGEILASYAAVSESARGDLLLSLQSISRRGRVHANRTNPLDLGESSEWLISRTDAEGTVQEADDALPHLLLRLLRNGEDRGIFDFRLYMPEE